MNAFPPPDATFAEIAAWHKANAKPDTGPYGLASNGRKHEAPEIENGPSIVCSACGVVRIGLIDPPFCSGCFDECERCEG